MSSPDEAAASTESAKMVDHATDKTSIFAPSVKGYTTQDNNNKESTDDTILLQHWQSHTPQKFIVIWLDPNIDESDKKYHDSIMQLRHIVNVVQLFTDVNQCIDFITNIEDGKFFFILSNNVTENIVSLINDVPQVDSIYMFNDKEGKYGQQMAEWRKVRGIFDDIAAIFDQLQQNIRQYEQDVISTNIFSSYSGLDLNELDQSFMYSVLLKEIILEMNYDEKAKTNFFKLYRDQHSRYQVHLNRADEMEKSYNQHSPIWWYIKKPFIYSILNTALRTQDIASIIKMGFYLKDLHQQIEEVYSMANQTETLVVYRGQSMSDVEFEKMKNNKGALLSFNNFLSTTVDRSIALRFADGARGDPQLTGILFHMEIDPSISKTPFAPLNVVSDCSGSEDEILFSMHTVFRIGEIDQIDNRLWNVKLIMTSDTDPQLERLTNRMREEIQGPDGMHRLGNLLVKMGQFKKAEEIYNTLLEMVSHDDSNELAYISNRLGSIYNEQGDLKMALSYLENTLRIRLMSIPPNYPDLATTYNNIGLVYEKMGEYSKALSFYEKTLDIRHQSLPPNHPDFATTYNNIGLVYDNMGEYSKALSCYEKTLEITQKTLPSNHPDLAITFNNIGLVYDNMGEYSKALSFYEKTLEIRQKTLPPNHPSLASSYNNIGSVRQVMGDYTKALFYLEKTLEIQQVTLPSNHPDLATTYNNIGSVHHSMGEYSKALSYLEKTLLIRQESLPPNHPHLATTYNTIGLVYHSIGEYSKAITYLEKTLDIFQKTLPSNHPSLAETYKNIGSVFQAMGNYPKALSFYEKTLDIQRISLPSNHSSLAETYNNIGQVHSSMKEYLIANSFYKKTLKIQQIALSHNHPSLAITYNNIGRVHAAMEHYSDALSCYEKTLKIQEKVLPSNHPSLADTYNNLGEMHRSVGNCSDALSYYKKTLDIQEKVLPPNHPSLATTYSNIGQVYFAMEKYDTAFSHLQNAIEIQAKSLPANHPSIALSHYNMAMILQGLYRHEEAVNHASQAVDVASSSIEPDHAQIEKYQQYLCELMAMTGCGNSIKKKENEQWIYPVLLVLPPLQESRLHSLLSKLTDDCLLPTIQTDKCIDALNSNKQIKNLIFEISSISIEERDSLLEAFSSVDTIESIYILGKPPATKKQRNEFFTHFDKVCLFCDDEEQLAVRWALDTANDCRISGNRCTETSDRNTARQHLQRGIDLYDRLSKFINATSHKTS